MISIEELEQTLTMLGVDERTLGLPVDVTLTGNTPVGETTLRSLPEISFSDNSSLADSFDFLTIRPLGQGGMGVVELATQTALQREVAVKKCLKATSPTAAESLLQEAMVNGFLEHPNIVPVYNVGRTRDGAVVVVMKRIEGRSWSEIHEKDELHLSDHLQILLKVCDALRFSHSKGIIHRDIKLDNVMVGSFSEVYLLDWGIAINIGPPRPPLPDQKSAAALAGTPGYMAPEMALQEPTQDERTDVYLLGATLHHILTGQPRHKGARVLEALFSASTSMPVDYGPEVPEELGAIANRACAKNPEDRYSSVDEFQEAILNHLEHRESNQLSEQARLSLQVLIEELGKDLSDAYIVHDLFSQARFGYQQALRMWEGNREAVEGLDAALRRMTQYHLEHENFQQAMACLLEMHQQDPALKTKLEEAESAKRARVEEVERLKRFESAMDLGAASRARSIITLALGIFWGVGTLFVIPPETAPQQEVLLSSMQAGFRNVGVVAALMLIFRRQILINRVNRSMYLLLAGTLFCAATLRWVAWYTNADLVMAQAVDMGVYALGIFAAGIFIDRRIAVASSIFAVCGIAGVLWPPMQLPLEALATVLTFSLLAFLWWPRTSKSS